MRWILRVGDDSHNADQYDQYCRTRFVAEIQFLLRLLEAELVDST